MLTSGMKPPCRMPRSARQTKNEVFPSSPYCPIATADQSTICVGIHRSGPTHLLTSCEGNSAHRKESRNTVFPRL